MFSTQGRSCIFMETALEDRYHAFMECIPVKNDLFKNADVYFKVNIYCFFIDNMNLRREVNDMNSWRTHVMNHHLFNDKFMEDNEFFDQPSNTHYGPLTRLVKDKDSVINNRKSNITLIFFIDLRFGGTILVVFEDVHSRFS